MWEFRWCLLEDAKFTPAFLSEGRCANRSISHHLKHFLLLFVTWLTVSSAVCHPEKPQHLIPSSTPTLSDSRHGPRVLKQTIRMTLLAMTGESYQRGKVKQVFRTIFPLSAEQSFLNFKGQLLTVASKQFSFDLSLALPCAWTSSTPASRGRRIVPKFTMLRPLSENRSCIQLLRIIVQTPLCSWLQCSWNSRKYLQTR